MQFYIQVGTPTILSPQPSESEDLSEAMQDIFASQTEDVILYWNGIPVRMGYKYQLSDLINKLLPLLGAVLHTSRGNYQLLWTSYSFYAHWFLTWDKSQLTIEAQWDKVAGRYEALLNSRNTVETSRELFLQEWKGLLRKIIEAIEVTGIEIEEQEEVEALYKIEAAIDGFGQLYEAQQIALSPVIRSTPPQEVFSIPTPTRRQYADVSAKGKLIRAAA